MKNSKNDLWKIGSYVIAGLSFFMKISIYMGMGLATVNVLIIAAGPIFISAVIAAVISLFFNKFKFKSTTFYKFLFWILLISSLGSLGSSLSG